MSTKSQAKRKIKPEFPKVIKAKYAPGITATIYRQARTKNDKDGNPREYVSYLVSYTLDGKRKMDAYSDPAEAETAAKNAVGDLANGRQGKLELAGRARETYERAVGSLEPLGISLDVAAADYVEVRSILNGSASPVEASRFWLKHHSKELPRITVPEAVEKCIAQARADGKSDARVKQLEWGLNAFAADTNVNVTDLTPGSVSRYLTDMTASERTKKNARDVLGYFGRWLVLHGYLDRGTDLVEGVQHYSMKPGSIEIFTPRKMALLLEHASDKLLPYLAIGAFAGLRQAEIQRLDWSEVDLEDGYIEVKAEKSKVDTRRLVPIKANLKAWLRPLAKKSGPVCPYANVVNELMDLVATINKTMPEGPDKMTWKKNGLRHSCISYRIAECADVARVADESGTSAPIIRTNYLRRVKPAQAAEWFNIMPAVDDKKVVPLTATK